MEKLHHIAIVVDKLDEKADWYCQIYGAKKMGTIFKDLNQKVKVQFIKAKGLLIELLEPLNDGSPITNFLNNHGSGGLYHIAIEVDDLVEIEEQVREKGGLIISKSKDGWDDMEVMFVMYIKDNEKQLVEYVVTKDNVV